MHSNKTEKQYDILQTIELVLANLAKSKKFNVNDFTLYCPCLTAADFNMSERKNLYGSGEHYNYS